MNKNKKKKLHLKKYIKKVTLKGYLRVNVHLGLINVNKSRLRFKSN